MASLATSQTERASIAAFKRDVIDASKTALILVDFWAEWCGPCKTLTPLLERVIATYAPRVQLVKIDVDKNQTIAAQFRIESIPTVYAFINGQPVDGFMGALGERELKAFIDRLVATLPPAPLDDAAQLEAIAVAAGEALAAGAHREAAEMYAAVAQDLPDRHDLSGGLARALLAGGDIAGADAALAAVPADSKDKAVVQARAGLALAREATPVADFDGLCTRVQANPDDHALRYELAGARMARGDRDGAAEDLLESIRRDPEWNEKAARSRLLKLFEAVGLSDPWVNATRRKLSTLLFS